MFHVFILSWSSMFLKEIYFYGCVNPNFENSFWIQKDIITELFFLVPMVS